MSDKTKFGLGITAAAVLAALVAGLVTYVILKQDVIPEPVSLVAIPTEPRPAVNEPVAMPESVRTAIEVVEEPEEPEPVIPEPTGSEVSYIGLIAGTSRFDMDLLVSGSTATGSYSYEKYGIPIELTGTLQGDKLRLSELDEQGRETALFLGTGTEPGIISGTWAAANGSRSLPFVLVEQQNELEGSAYVSGKWENENGEVNILLVEPGLLRVSGLSFWYGPMSIHTGTLDGTAHISHLAALYADENGCEATLDYKGELLIINDNMQCGGLNVTFTGEYRKTHHMPDFDLLLEGY